MGDFFFYALITWLILTDILFKRIILEDLPVAMLKLPFGNIGQ